MGCEEHHLARVLQSAVSRHHRVQRQPCAILPAVNNVRRLPEPRQLRAAGQDWPRHRRRQLLFLLVVVVVGVMYCVMCRLVHLMPVKKALQILLRSFFFFFFL